jgi:hypothetical protein
MGCLRRRWRDISEHGAHEGLFVVDPERLVVTFLKPDRGDRTTA